jgi:hypothetical protein
MARKSPKKPLAIQQSIILFEVVYSIVYGASFGALLPDALTSAQEHGFFKIGAITWIVPCWTGTLAGLFILARIRLGGFKLDIQIVAGTIVATFLFSGYLILIKEWPLLSLCACWTLPYVLWIALGPKILK